MLEQIEVSLIEKALVKKWYLKPSYTVLKITGKGGSFYLEQILLLR